MSRLFDGSLETSSLEPEQPLEVNNDFYAAYNNYVMENYTAKQGGDGIVAEDAKWLLRTGQLTSNMMYTGYIRENDANRIAAAQLVQQFLTSKAFKYSKILPPQAVRMWLRTSSQIADRAFVCILHRLAR